MKYVFPPLVVALIAGPATADLTARFYEGAPTDRFEIEYSGACPLSDLQLEIDLGASAAGLILDVTASGAGVSVYQPLKVVAGEALLDEVPIVQDGDTRISLPVLRLGPGDKIAFTLDVDDTKGSGPTMISGAEITGARICMKSAYDKSMATFDDTGTARLKVDGCNA